MGPQFNKQKFDWPDYANWSGLRRFGDRYSAGGVRAFATNRRGVRRLRGATTDIWWCLRAFSFTVNYRQIRSVREDWSCERRNWHTDGVNAAMLLATILHGRYTKRSWFHQWSCVQKPSALRVMCPDVITVPFQSPCCFLGKARLPADFQDAASPTQNHHEQDIHTSSWSCSHFL